MPQATYITPDELARAYDSRPVGELSSDDGTVGVINPSNEILMTAIERASADVESAVLKSRRYTIEDLQALQANDDWTLKGIVADLAVAHLYQRRGTAMPDAWQRAADRAEAQLEALRTGREIFTDDAAAAAGEPRPRTFTSTARSNLGIISDTPYFPGRLNRRLAGGGR